MVKNRLKEILKTRGIKQDWLAEQIGVNRNTISNIINNKYKTYIDVAITIAECLNLKVDDIWYNDKI